jgi:hypothetical protein
MSLSTACKAGSLASPVWQKLTPKKWLVACFCLRYNPATWPKLTWYSMRRWLYKDLAL